MQRAGTLDEAEVLDQRTFGSDGLGAYTAAAGLEDRGLNCGDERFDSR